MRTRIVIGPDGTPLSLADLPRENEHRWVIRRKAIVIAAVEGGLLTLEDACERYKLSRDEFLSWREMVKRYGFEGLRSTKTQIYREKEGKAIRRSIDT